MARKKAEPLPWDGPDEMVRQPQLTLVADDGEPKVGRLETAADARDFILAGKAYVTLVSKATGTRYTFKINPPKGKTSPHFVSVLFGSNNEEDYVFMGTIFPDGFRRGPRSAIGEDDVRVRAWGWAWAQIAAGKMPDKLEVWHEGRCGRCGRLLTVPASIARGIGPECASKGMM